MKLTAHPFFYSASCENCGQTITISYRDLRACFSGTLPDEVVIRGSLLCVCEAATPEMSAGALLPFKH